MDARVYDLNLIPGSVPQIIRLNQYDKGIPFKFTVYQGDRKFSIPSGAIVALSGTKPDGLGFHYACTFSGSTVSVTIGDQVAVLSGNVRAELTITSGDSVRLGTANFTFCVEPAALRDDTSVSDSDFPEIIKAANNIGAAQKSADAAARSAQDAKNSASSAASAASNAISGEVTRAKAAEKANADAISAETTRAKAAEKKNADAIKTKMTTATYDANGNGIVDNAEKVGGHTVLKDVPANAVFTDHIYDDAAVKKSVSDLQTNLTNGTIKVNKASVADSATSVGWWLSSYHATVPDNGGRRKYLLMYDITDWVPKTNNAGTYGFDGIFIAKRSGGFVGSDFTGTLSIVASWNGTAADGSKITEDNESSLRLRTTSSTYIPRVLHNKTTDRYYLTLMTNGSGRDLILFGVFSGPIIGTWIENTGSNLSNGSLPSDYEEYSKSHVLTPYERALADTNGKDIKSYLSGLSYSNGVIKYTLGNGTSVNIQIPEATSSAKGLLSASDKALIDRISKINLTRVQSVSNVSWAIDNSDLNQDISRLLPGKYMLKAKFKIETDKSSGLQCAHTAWTNQIGVCVGTTLITNAMPGIAIPIGTKVGYTVTNYCTFTISEANAHASNFRAYFYLAGDGTSNRPYVGSVSNIELTMVN